MLVYRKIFSLEDYIQEPCNESQSKLLFLQVFHQTIFVKKILLFCVKFKTVFFKKSIKQKYTDLRVRRLLNKKRVFATNHFKVFICKSILRFMIIKKISSGSRVAIQFLISPINQKFIRNRYIYFLICCTQMKVTYLFPQNAYFSIKF